ncbi:MAG: SDR family oxidoreductase, partial [Candidatus Aminicenantes bacterium]|nr:SDR family oxidoreductase [Candidatus Aminicenantes bacterium]
LAKDIDAKENLVVDIGSEQMSFKHMLERAARVMGLRRRLIPVPVLSPKLSSYWLILFTPVSYRIAKALVEGLKSETVIQNDNAAKYFPGISPLSYEKAVEAALAEIESSQVISRWCDSSAGQACDIKGLDQIDKAVLTDRKVFGFENIRAERVFDSVQSLGGETGWLKYNWLWKLRGLMDKILGGPGLNRGRRDWDELRIGDSLDFWKVVDVKRGKRLLLLSQMKLPGKAWLEFSIGDRVLIQTAYFLPRGLAGRLYWTLVKPFHFFAFKGLARGIINRAKEKSRTGNS